MTRPHPIWIAAGLGVIAGLRAFTAPAALSRAVHNGLLPDPGPRLGLLGSPYAVGALALMAAGELVGDKLPSTPNRTDPGPLTARIVSGALCGAVVSAAYDEPVIGGALIGGLAALAGSHLGYQARHWAVSAAGAPAIPAALAEDTVAVLGATRLLSA